MLITAVTPKFRLVGNHSFLLAARTSVVKTFTTDSLFFWPTGVPDAHAFVTALTELISQSVRQNVRKETRADGKLIASDLILTLVHLFSNLSLRFFFDYDVTRLLHGLLLWMKMTAEQFVSSLQTLNVRFDSGVVGHRFAEVRGALEPVICAMSCRNASFPRIQNIEWRIELEVHRKNLRNVYTPVVLMAFVCEESGIRRKTFARMRVSDVYHMRQVVEEALAHAKSHQMERQVRKWL